MQLQPFRRIHGSILTEEELSRIRHDSEVKVQPIEHRRIRRLSDRIRLDSEDLGAEAQQKDVEDRDEQKRLERVFTEFADQYASGLKRLCVMNKAARNTSEEYGKHARQDSGQRSGVMRPGASGCSVLESHGCGRLNTGLHLTVGCSIKEWLIATGIEPHPGPVGNFVSWPEACSRLESEPSWQGRHTQVGEPAAAAEIPRRGKSQLECRLNMVMEDTQPEHEREGGRSKDAGLSPLMMTRT